MGQYGHRCGPGSDLACGCGKPMPVKAKDVIHEQLLRCTWYCAMWFEEVTCEQTYPYR